MKGYSRCSTNTNPGLFRNASKGLQAKDSAGAICEKKKHIRKTHTENGILLLKIALTESCPGALLVSSFTSLEKHNKPNKCSIKSFEKGGEMQMRNEQMAKTRSLNSTRDVE